jgi:hypothetical protein
LIFLFVVVLLLFCCYYFSTVQLSFSPLHSTQDLSRTLLRPLPLLIRAALVLQRAAQEIRVAIFSSASLHPHPTNPIWSTLGRCKLQSRYKLRTPFISNSICDLLPYKFLSVLSFFPLLVLFLSFCLPLCFLSFLHSFKFFFLSLFLAFIDSYCLSFFSFSLIPSARSLQCGHLLLMENIARDYCEHHLSGQLAAGTELQAHMAAIEKEQMAKLANIAEWNAMDAGQQTTHLYSKKNTQQKVRLLQLSPEPLPLL